MRAVLLLMGVFSLVGLGWGQDCPHESSTGPTVESVPRTLSGVLVYHNEIRQWLGLKLDEPICGVTEVQVFSGSGSNYDDGLEKLLEQERGCRVWLTGPLGIPMTGYYSAEVYQVVSKLEPLPGCIKQPPLPDYSKLKPGASVRSYTVMMMVNYAGRGGRVSAIVRSGGRILSPWQVYASYTLTGAYAFYGNCADGFKLSHVTGSKEAYPDGETMDNMAMMDPEGAAAKGVRHVRLSYRCSR